MCTLDAFTQRQEPQRCKLQTARCPSISLRLAVGCLLLVFVLVWHVFLLLLFPLSCFVPIIWLQSQDTLSAVAEHKIYFSL